MMWNNLNFPLTVCIHQQCELKLVNKYYQRWILQTFNVKEEDSECQNVKKK